MKEFVLSIVAVLAVLMSASIAFADAYISGHYTTDGIYVGTYFRSNPGPSIRTTGSASGLVQDFPRLRSGHLRGAPRGSRRAARKAKEKQVSRTKPGDLHNISSKNWSIKGNVKPSKGAEGIRCLTSGTASTKYGKVFGLDGSVKYTYALITSK